MRELIGNEVTDNSFERRTLERVPGLDTRSVRTLESLPDSRDTIVQSVNDLVSDTNEIEGQPFLTWDTASDLMTACRLLLGTAANVSLTISPTQATIDLIDTAVTPGTYGSASRLASFTVDAKGRITSAQQFVINTDNIVEGVMNLFFTVARARAAVSGASGVAYNAGTGVFTLDQAFSRGLISGSGQISYNSATGQIGSTGFTGGPALYTSLTFVNGICTAAS